MGLIYFFMGIFGLLLVNAFWNMWKSKGGTTPDGLMRMAGGESYAKVKEKPFDNAAFEKGMQRECRNCGLMGSLLKKGLLHAGPFLCEQCGESLITTPSIQSRRSQDPQGCGQASP